MGWGGGIVCIGGEGGQEVWRGHLRRVSRAEHVLACTYPGRMSAKLKKYNFSLHVELVPSGKRRFLQPVEEQDVNFLSYDGVVLLHLARQKKSQQSFANNARRVSVPAKLSRNFS